jgi:hypothetical protein
MKKYPAIVLSLFLTNLIFSQSRVNYNLHQFHLGTESSIIHRPTIEIGYDFRKVIHKVHIKRFGMIASHFYESKKNSNLTAPFQFNETSSGENRIEKSYNENYLRLKPFIERGRKIICKDPYGLDIGAVLGMGLNILRKIEIDYLTINEKGIIKSELQKETFIDKNKSFFMQPDLFTGLRFNNYFSLQNGKYLFLSGLVAYDLGLYNSPIKGWLFQFDLGISFSSSR